ncbi:exosortase C-terminal domain/associated protein EpsI [Desulfoluna spongiiphila]|uniref:exosortase C-terminal domain/associated protein EpsI n=1 Tax=Desulfoluna spongiiphila TaxID=419481 RepID=UPI001256F67D|nr:exosortase C-terminal domain/associated protein EpsI [Desulfoluna spongiiphila]VVS93984.1 methanolan biosynthesis epsi [Desulfoluna spongiiphila]
MSPRTQNQALPHGRMVCLVLVMLVAAVAIRGMHLTESVPLKQSFEAFPMEIGPWIGETSRFDEKIYEALGVDDSILGTYRTARGDAVQLYIGYYHSQKKGDLIHSPKNCMPGSGWAITHSSLEEVGGTGPGDTFQAIKLFIENGGERHVVLYWFQSRGRIISSEYMQKIYLVVDSIFKRRTDGSFVRLISPVRGGDADAATQQLKAFAHDLAPVLHAYLPS